MFSENQKISIRQIKRLLILDLFGISSLLLPGLLAKTVGTDGIFCIIIAAILTVVYIWVMGKVLKQMQGSCYAHAKKLLGLLGSDIFMLFYLFFFLLLGAFLLYQLTGIVRTWLLPQGNYILICFLLLLLAGYGNLRGIEGRARIYEILFWFLGAPLLWMLFLATKAVNVDYWTPIVNSSAENFGTGIFWAAAFFLPVSMLLFLKPHCNKPEKLCSCGKTAVWITAILNIAIYLILLGNFQVKTTSVLEYPVITLMSMIKLPGGFLARMDAFMTAIWFFSVFALMNTGVYYANHILKELFSEKRTHYGLVVILLLVLATARWFFAYPGAVDVYIVYLKYIAMPFLVLAPVILWLLGRIRLERTGDRHAVD